MKKGFRITLLTTALTLGLVCFFLFPISGGFAAPRNWNENEGAATLLDAVQSLELLSELECGEGVDASGCVTGDGRIGLGEAVHALQLVSGLRVYEKEEAEFEPNAFLSGITLLNVSINEAFFPVVFSYSARVANHVTSTRVVPVTKHPDALVTVNGEPVTSGQASPPVDLGVGSNIIDLEVSIEGGNITRSYEINVTRDGEGPGTSAYLSSLELSEGELKETFAPAVLEYTAYVMNYVEAVSVTAAPAGEGASVLINGEAVPAGEKSGPIPLGIGENVIPITVTAEDGETSLSYAIKVMRHGAPDWVADTVYVVDAPAQAPDQFEDLPHALAHLSDTLAPDQLGEVRIRTTHPMEVDSLAFSCNVVITLDREEASNTIIGPVTEPLFIDAGGSLDISGISFVNDAGFVINSNGGFRATGTEFNGDTAINLQNDHSPADDRSPLSVRRPSGFLPRDLELEHGIISGGLSISAKGESEREMEILNTQAAAIDFDGALTGESSLVLEGNPISNLNLELELKNKSTMDINGHTGLELVSASLEMEGDARAGFRSNTIARLEAEWGGFKGTVSLQDTFVSQANTVDDGVVDVSAEEFEWESKNSYSSTFKMDVGHSGDNARFGFNQDGGYFDYGFSVKRPDAGLSAEADLGFRDLTFNGDAEFFLNGKVTMDFSDNVRFGASASLSVEAGSFDLDIQDAEFEGKLFLEAHDIVELNAGIERTKCDDDVSITALTGNISIRFDLIHTSRGIQITGAEQDLGVFQSMSRSVMQAAGSEVVIRSLQNTRSVSGRPSLYLAHLDVPVTIEDSNIKGDEWTVVLDNVDADVNMRNNEIKGPVLFDGDPDLTGSMIDRTYTVTASTFSQMGGVSPCILARSIADVALIENHITAEGFVGVHGLHVHGSTVEISGGSITTPGWMFGNFAISISGSASGHNGIVHAHGVSPLMGAVQISEDGYAKLTGNDFQDSAVIVEDDSNLLNDVLSDNTGLEPEDIIVIGG